MRIDRPSRKRCDGSLSLGSAHLLTSNVIPPRQDREQDGVRGSHAPRSSPQPRDEAESAHSSDEWISARIANPTMQHTRHVTFGRAAIVWPVTSGRIRACRRPITLAPKRVKTIPTAYGGKLPADRWLSKRRGGRGCDERLQQPIHM